MSSGIPSLVRSSAQDMAMANVEEQRINLLSLEDRPSLQSSSSSTITSGSSINLVVVVVLKCVVYTSH